MYRLPLFRPALAALVLVLGSSLSQAQTIQYDVSPLGANVWQYDYSISNTMPGLSFDEFTIYFDPTAYASLSLVNAPSDWDPLVIQPDTAIPAVGYLDAIDLEGLLTDGSSATGFSMSFAFLGGGTPGSQPFDVYNSSDFSLQGSGTTVPTAVTPLPEPPTYLLMLGALALVACYRRRRGRDDSTFRGT